jgi:hypothetical protein
MNHLKRSIGVLIAASAALAVLLAFTASVAPMPAAAEPAAAGPETASVTGEVIDLSCYVRAGMKGAGHADCAASCGKAGVPLAILEDESEKVWIVVSEKDMEPPNAKLLPFVAKKVTVTGKVYERGGQRIIAMSTVKGN